MEKIHVKATKSYDILLGDNLLNDLSQYIATLISSKEIVIITDNNVDNLYGDRIFNQFTTQGYSTYKYVFSAGENSKNISTYYDIMQFLAKSNISRTATIIAFGGGVVGDMAGFVSSTYMRGVKYIQVPTTLLAMVDSAVGGKTAIDLPQGKNLVGAFYSPTLVVADTSLLSTLPHAEIQNGWGEIIKYGVLAGGELWDIINGNSNNLSQIIALCINQKKQIVEEDEYESGKRKLLNLGHTLGHSVEKLSNYSIPHGKAVAIGIALMAKISNAHYGLPDYSLQQILSLIDKKDLSLSHNYSVDELITSAHSDKKSDGGDMIDIVAIKDIGNCIIDKISFAQFKEYLA